MRTRFLSTDYFFADDSVEWLRPLVFAPLPEQCLPPLYAPSAAETLIKDLENCSESPSLSVIDKFPFERALSQFLSVVIPKVTSERELSALDLRSDSREELVFQEAATFLCEGLETSGEDECEPRNFCPEITKVHDHVGGRKGNESSEILKFEIVEVDCFQSEQAMEFVNASKFKDKGISFSSGSFGINLDMVPIEHFEKISCQADVYKSLYLIENMPSNSNLNHQVFHSTGDSCQPNQIIVSLSNFPEFEVCDTFFKDDKYECSEAFSLSISCLKECDHSQGSDSGSSLEDFNIPLTDHDIMNYSSVKTVAEKIPEFEVLSLNHIIDMDTPSYKGNDFQRNDTSIDPTEACGNSSRTSFPLILQEVQILDVCYMDFFPVLGIDHLIDDKEKFDLENEEDTMTIHKLYESLVSFELCLVDEMFQSLPTPMIFEDKKFTSLNLVIDHFLDTQKLHTISAGDGIYLDWHPLTKGTCNQKNCSSYIDSLMTVEICLIDSGQLLLGGESTDFDLKILDDECKVTNASSQENFMSMLSSLSRNADEVIKNVASPHIPQSLSKRIEPSSQNQSNNRGSLLNVTMSKPSDLNSFVNARRGLTCKTGKSSTEKQCIQEVVIIPHSSTIAVSSDPSEVGFHVGNFQEHDVILTDHILEVAGSLKKIYLAIFKNEINLDHKLGIFSVMDDMELMKFPQYKLLELVTKTSTESEAFWPLIGLCVTKQLAYYLCYFGVHTAHRYMRKIFHESEYLKMRLSSTFCLVEDAFRKTDLEGLELHPALSIIEGVINRKNLLNCEKTLIVADELFWPSLSKKLTSMKKKFHALTHLNYFEEHSDIWLHELRNSILEALHHSDYIIVSHEQVSETFPLNKFYHILEYGGSHSSPRVCNQTADLVPLPRSDFIKSRLDKNADVLSICEGVSYPVHHMLENCSIQITDMLRLSPSKEISNTVSLESTSRVGSTSKGPCLSNSAVDSLSSSSDSVIILNIQKTNKEMLASRRSSYKKILEMEKNGIQTVERELILPLDLILTASHCLIWYDVKGVRNTVAEAGGGSQIARFMETLATSILMSVSFAFSCCILIFEGDCAFLGAIMDFSDALYAAAASLDMHVQLFCSYSPESTDEIVHACINYSTRINRGLYPSIMESEILAESFLTGFPSVNTLSAHAILSSCNALADFLHWTFEDKVQAVRKYHVPEESMALFCRLCRYGELGESKSGTTDCSSIDSDLSSGRAQYRRKRQNTNTSDAVKFTTDDCVYFKPESNSHQETFESSKQSKRFFMGNTCGMSGVSQKPGNFMHPIIDEPQCDKWDAKPSRVNVIDQKGAGGYKKVFEDLNGEVINWNIDFLKSGFQSAEIGVDSFRTETLTGKFNQAEGYGYASASNLFPLASDIKCDGTWVSTKQHCQVPENSTTPKRYEDSDKENYSDGNILGPAKKQKLMASFRGTLFTKSCDLSRKQEDAPWTAELLKGVQEKSKMKQNPPLSDTFLARPGSSKNTDKLSLRRSPHSIDSYRYQGTSRRQKTFQGKKKKNMGTPRSSSNEKKSASSSAMAPTWTPTDKRARQNLSFTRYGQEKQSKLVWTNRNFAGGDGNARKRLFDET